MHKPVNIPIMEKFGKVFGGGGAKFVRFPPAGSVLTLHGTFNAISWFIHTTVSDALAMKRAMKSCLGF